MNSVGNLKWTQLSMFLIIFTSSLIQNFSIFGAMDDIHFEFKYLSHFLEYLKFLKPGGAGPCSDHVSPPSDLGNHGYRHHYFAIAHQILTTYKATVWPSGALPFTFCLLAPPLLLSSPLRLPLLLALLRSSPMRCRPPPVADDLKTSYAHETSPRRSSRSKLSSVFFIHRRAPHRRQPPPTILWASRCHLKLCPHPVYLADPANCASNPFPDPSPSFPASQIPPPWTACSGEAPLHSTPPIGFP
jgi:hypothetical protein